MQVFRLCMKIIQRNLSVMMIYVGVFMGVSLIMSASMSGAPEAQTEFGVAKTRMAFIVGAGSPLTEGLKQELSKIAEIVVLPDEKEALQDALYFRSVSYILRVPDGFGSDFMAGAGLQLEKTVIPNSIANAYIDLVIEKYLNNARLYVRNLPGITEEQLARRLKDDFATGVSVELITGDSQLVSHTYANYFFNYLAYSLLFVLILGISVLMLVFNDPDIKRRNTCAPISIGSFNRQFICANLVFTFAAWFIMVLFASLFNLRNSLNINTVYFLVNSFAFAICGASLGFLIGNLVKGREAVSAVSNVLTLGTCFISGVFVPQQYLGESVLAIARLTPTYWFVRANNHIAEISRFGFAELAPVFTSVAVQIGFAIVMFAAAMIIARKKRYS